MGIRTSKKTQFPIPMVSMETARPSRKNANSSAPIKFQATQDSLGFVSCTVGFDFRAMGVTFTPQIAQKICWEDAKAMYKAPKGVEQYSRWQFALQTFCCGEEKLVELMMQMTAAYLDFKAGVVSEKHAQGIVREKTQEIEKYLYGASEQLNFREMVPTYSRKV